MLICYKNGTERPLNCEEMITVGKHPDEQAQANNVFLAEIKKQIDMCYSMYEWISCSDPEILRSVKAVAAEV